MDFKLENVLLSLHSLKTMGLGPFGISAPLFLRNGELLGHSPIHNFKTVPRALIVNVSTHDQVGSHWVALFIVDTRNAEFFDSYGLAPSQYSKYFSEFFQRQDITKIDYNTKRLQSDQTNVCGHYVLYYLHMRCRGVGDITDWYCQHIWGKFHEQWCICLRLC